jgi:hypothetical protein
MVVMCDKIVLSEEDIQFVDLGFPPFTVFRKVHVIENDIEVVSPVV